MFKIILFFIFIAFYSSIFATNKPYSFEELQSIAYKNNANLKSAHLKWKASSENINIESSLPDPVISYNEFIEKVQTRTGSQVRKFSLKQQIPWFNTISTKTNIASLISNIYELEVSIEKINITQSLKNELSNLILIDKKIKINEESIRVFNDLEKSLKERINITNKNLTHILQIQIDSELLKNNIETLALSKKPILKKIERIIGDRLYRRIPLNLKKTTINFEKSKLTDYFHQHNPSWNKHLTLESIAKYNNKLASLKNKPTFNFGYNWIQTTPSKISNPHRNGKDPSSVTFSMSIPIWKAKKKARLNKAKLELEETISLRKAVIDRFKQNIEKELFNIQSSKRKNLLYTKKLLPRAIDAYKSAKISYEAGELSLQEIYDSYQLILKLKLNFEINNNLLMKAGFNLEKLIGFTGDSDYEK